MKRVSRQVLKGRYIGSIHVVIVGGVLKGRHMKSTIEVKGGNPVGRRINRRNSITGTSRGPQVSTPLSEPAS